MQIRIHVPEFDAEDLDSVAHALDAIAGQVEEAFENGDPVQELHGSINVDDVLTATWRCTEGPDEEPEGEG